MGHTDGLPPSMAENWLEFATKFYVLPGGQFLAIWDGFIVCVAVLNTVMLTFMAAFQVVTPGAWVLCYLMDVIFMADICRYSVALVQGGVPNMGHACCISIALPTYPIPQPQISNSIVPFYPMDSGSCSQRKWRLNTFTRLNFG